MKLKLTSQLSIEDEKDIKQALNQFEEWSDLDYYVDNKTEYDSYKETLNKSSSSAGCIAPIIVFVIATITLVFAFMALGDSTNFGSSCLAISLYLVGIVWAFVSISNKNKLKKKVEEFQNLYDINRLNKVDSRYKSSRNQVTTKMREIENNIVALIGKMPAFD
jgi:hypothetical protein